MATGNGGGVFMDIGVLNSFSNVTLQDNTAATGGAMMLQQAVVLECHSCKFFRNLATASGGAVAMATDEGVEFTSSVFLCVECHMPF